MADNDIRAVHLIAEATQRAYSRRAIIKRGLGMGLSLSAIGWVLAACGGSSPSENPTAPPSSSTATTEGEAAETPSSDSPLTGGTPQGGGRLTILLHGTTGDYDPHSAYDEIASLVFMGAYEMLIKLKGNSTSEYEPALAKEWGVSADGLEWTFTLFDDVVFHDGTPCDAEAVVRSFQRYLKMEMGPVDVVGRFIDDPDTDIVAVDSHTVRFKINHPNPIFEAALASQYGPYVVSPAAMEEHATSSDPWAHDWFTRNLVGTGPYRVVELEPQSHILLERFPEYHQGWDGVHFDEVVIRVVEDIATRQQLITAGEADALINSLSPDNLDSLRQNPNVQVIEFPTTNVEWAWINCGDRLKDPDVRRGFCYAFPYEEVREGVFRGLLEKTGGPLTPTTLGYDPDVFIYETDLDKAKELIGKVFEPGETFVWMIYADSPTAKAAATLFQANLQQIGYNLDIQEVDRGAVIELAYGEAPASERPDFFGTWGWFPDYNDGYNELAPNFDSSGVAGMGSNLGYYHNERIDEILQELAAGVSEDDYFELLAEAQNILTEQDPPCIYYGALKHYAVLRTDIRGFDWNPIYLGTFDFYKMHRVS